MAEEKKEDFLTWRNLLEFCKTVPEEHLDNVVRLLEADRDIFVEDVAFRDAIYYNPDDYDDAWPADEYISELNAGRIENPEDYVYSDTKPPFLFSS